MDWKTFGLAVLVPFSSSPANVQSPDCASNILQSVPRPELSGSADITSRTYVIRESESPVAIVRVDLSEVTRDEDREGLHAIGGAVQVEVQNVSDRTLDEVWIAVFHRLGAVRTGWGGGARATRSALAPGERVWVRRSGRVSSAEAVKVESRYQTLVSVESASFGTCVYHPKSPWHSSEWLKLP